MHHSLIISNTAIKQDEKGRYCLNDLHRAAGAEAKHQPSNFMRMDGTKDLIAEINQSSEVMSVYINVGGTNPGTFACRELVYAYAMWISAKFHLQVIRAYDALTAPAVPVELSRMDILTLAMESEKGRLVAVEQLAIAAPKADALDRIAGATGSITIREAAKDLQVKPLTFSNWLREHKWIYKQGRSNLAHQPRIDAGYMAHKVTLVEVEGDDGVTFEKPVTQARITPKGLAKLAVVFGEVAA